MVYSPQSSPLFDKNFKRLTKKNAVLKEQAFKKIKDEIWFVNFDHHDYAYDM